MSEDTILTAITRLGTEEECRAFLQQLRWPAGVRCPRCDAAEGISRIQARGQFECSVCGYQFSVRSGTVFHGSNLPLSCWFRAIDTIDQHPDVSTRELEQLLDVSYKTAWYLRHRIRAAMSAGVPEIGWILNARN